ncbi:MULTISPECIES: hypothetical protein [Actinoplanes]|uniref:hypothetical protein n=1 Tax=Actinoplanes TaxID=1865 RepID=UPI0005F2FE68|nr:MULTISPECIES: hypothetical protein [Actinoplanes]GLY06920.1 hypothetical protein Acsp01_72990 [Actinoplanes sp. NBRC 101535]
MPEKELTLAQRATLVALMIKASPLPRTFLADTVKISLDKPKRDDLRDRKLITVTDKPLVLELTENGWARAIEELSADIPPRAGALGGTLYLLLGFLRQYLDHHDLSAADFFGSVAAPTAAPVTVPDTDTGEVERTVGSEIRVAYDGLAHGPNVYVMLEDLRAALPGVSRDDFDTALLDLDRQPDVHLVPESNQKVLTAGQRAAAVRIGNQDMHLLAVRS